MSLWREALGSCFAAAIAVGCSGQSSGSPPPDAGAEAAINRIMEASTTEIESGPDAANETPATCSPMSTGVPVWMPPTGYPNSACTPADVATLVHDCVVNDLPACRQDLADLSGCTQCLLTPADSPAWGAGVETAGRVFLNIGGCFAIEMGDSSSTGCGAARGRLDDCVWSSCALECFAVDAGEVDGGNDALYEACRAEARLGLCATYLTALNNACPTSSPAYPVCEGDLLTDEEYWDQLGDIFCAAGADGGSSTDGGSSMDGGGSADGGASTDAAVKGD